jgi:hypothetical protein
MFFPPIADINARLDARFKATPPASLEAAQTQERVEYLRVATDLQVAKGSGLLAFTALTSALAVVLYDKLPGPPVSQALCIASGLVSLLASVLMLRTVWSEAPTPAQFAQPEAEAAWLVDLLHRRGWLSNMAVALALAASVGLVVALAGALMPTVCPGAAAQAESRP